jgi:hypothetical protein
VYTQVLHDHVCEGSVSAPVRFIVVLAINNYATGGGVPTHTPNTYVIVFTNCCIYLHLMCGRYIIACLD